MRDAKILTLSKDKGKRNVCNNYKGISLLSIVDRIFAEIILARLQVIAQRVYPDSRCDFCAERSTIDMIFSLYQLQETNKKQRMPLYVAFIDPTKTFDLVSRSVVQNPSKDRLPLKAQSIIKSFYNKMKRTVQFDSNLSKPFDI